MLKIQNITDSQSVHDVLKEMDLKSQSWILSDLRSKKAVQDYFINTYGYYPDESILRASDLWKKILFRIQPSVQVLSHQALLVHIRFFLNQYAQDLHIPMGSEPTLLKWMNDFAPLYFHPDGIQKIEEFWEAHPESSSDWKTWWFRVRATFSYFESLQLLIPQWIPSYLQTENQIEKYWNRSLIVDLGGQFSAVEAGLFQNLSKNKDVLILNPELKNSNQYEALLRPYKELMGFAELIKSQHTSDRNESEIKTIRSSSTLNSFRSAISQIRKWIESGVSPSNVAVVMPDIEDTWPCLRYYLEAEGIPFSRDTQISIQSLPEVQVFLARLRTIGKGLSSRDLELSLFSIHEKSDLQFEKFVSLFTHLYEESDYGRHQLALKVIQQEFNPLDLISPDEYLIRMIQVWNSEEVPFWLESLLKQILSQFQKPISVAWSEWVLLTEGLLSSAEVSENSGHNDGVVVSSLAATHFLKSEYLLLLEMSDENLKNLNRKGLPSSAAKLISNNLGFWLQDADTSHLDFELAWLLQKKTLQTYFYYSEISISGELQTAHSRWISLARNQNLKVEEVPTVVSSRMISDLSLLNTRYQQDMNAFSIQNLQKIDIQKLSPSSIESFLRCPFIYFARQTVGLKVYPELNLEQDPRDRGQIIHKIFEKALHNDNHNFEEIVDSAVNDLKLVIDVSLWPVMRKKYVQLLARFVDFEKKWKKEFNQTEKHHLEVKWQGQFQDVSISGQIDRIDQSTEGDLIILDYKNSKSQLKGAHQWLANNNIQMLFYIWALQQSWIQNLKGEVLAALYYVVKDFDRTIGLESVESRDGFYKPSTKKKQRLSPDQWTKLMKDFEAFLSQTLNQMKAGDIKPVPFDEEICSNCDWRKVCRAPHLS
jgi:ATP-dependent helicase/nuclease subunit B